jgi:hypothetical protein
MQQSSVRGELPMFLLFRRTLRIVSIRRGSANDATDRLYDRYPDAQPWVIRIGHRAVYRFGSRSLKKSV